MSVYYDYSRLAEDLEKQELQSFNGIASPQVYGQLLAIYLLIDDLYVLLFFELSFNFYIIFEY